MRDGDVVTLRPGPESPAEAIEAFYPDVVRALRALPVNQVAFDGELVSFDATGRPNFGLLAKRVAQLAKGEPRPAALRKCRGSGARLTPRRARAS